MARANTETKARAAVISHLRNYADHQENLGVRHEENESVGVNPDVYTRAAELCRRIADVVESGLFGWPGDEGFPGMPGSRWRDHDGDPWILGDDGKMRMTHKPTEPVDANVSYGPWTRIGGV